MKIRPSSIAATATALLLAGSLALAAPGGDLGQDGRPGGGSAGLADKGAGGDIVDVDRKLPFGGRDLRTDICGDLGTDEKCRSRAEEDTGKTEVFSRYSGFCLPFPVNGRLFCWE